MPRVELIGVIVRLQVQRASLKLESTEPDSAHPRYYDPVGLVSVPAMLLTPDGVLGLPDDAEQLIDVHHLAHPSTKNNRGTNGVSVGFTAHYAEMRQQLGDHLEDGIAGENVLVELSQHVSPEEAAHGIVIETADGTCACLEQVVVAEPCVEFTRFCLRLGPAERSGALVTESLRFLREGMRGYYARYTGSPLVVHLGDRLRIGVGAERD